MHKRNSDLPIYKYDKIIEFLTSLLNGAKGIESILALFFGQFGALMGAPGVTNVSLAYLGVDKTG